MNTAAPSGDGGGETGRVAVAFLAALGDVDVEAMGAVLADDVVFTVGFIRLPGKEFVLRQLPLLLGEVEVEVSEPVVEGQRAVARITMDGGVLGSLEGEAKLVVSGGMVSEVELVLVRVVVEVQPGRYRLTDPAFAALEGAQAFHGELDGTVYRIEVPDGWNGRLVMWAHGFRDFTPDLVADLPPMRALLIEKGYAWAASSFSSNGFAPYEAALETAALHDLFIERFGKPKYTYAAGASMGGNAVLLSLELYPEAVRRRAGRVQHDGGGRDRLPGPLRGAGGICRGRGPGRSRDGYRAGRVGGYEDHAGAGGGPGRATGVREPAEGDDGWGEALPARGVRRALSPQLRAAGHRPAADAAGQAIR